MAVTLVGVSHHGAPLDIRERLAYRASELGTVLTTLREEGGAAEAVVLSTCNRTEIYVAGGEDDPAPFLWSQLGKRLGHDASSYGYVYRDKEAITHLFRVASGLDSMILGEAQIHGQVRSAWESSRAHSGVVLNRVFQNALLVAGRVRSETAVGHGAASVSSAAVQIAKQIFGSLAGRRAMVLGAGEMAELALECLTDEGVQTAIVANRTLDRAQTLAGRYGAEAIGYEECWRALGRIDVLLCSTAAPRPVVTPEHIRPVLAQRRGHPLCILDIAMPRDVDPLVRSLDNVFLYDLDDLQAVVAANIERRRGEMSTAESLVDEETIRTWDWLSGLSVVPVLTQFRARHEALRVRELDAVMRKLAALPPEQRQIVEQFSRSLMNKFLHEPTVRLRSAAVNGQGLGTVEALRYLFALEQPPADEDENDAEPAPAISHTAMKGER